MKTLPALALLLLLSACGRESEFDLAVDAFEAGNYDTALAGFTALAQRGDAKSQNNLGIMYERGLGVDQNHREETAW